MLLEGLRGLEGCQPVERGRGMPPTGEIAYAEAQKPCCSEGGDNVAVKRAVGARGYEHCVGCRSQAARGKEVWRPEAGHPGAWLVAGSSF